MSEVSHLHGGDAYCFGGGLYIDPVFPDYAGQGDRVARADRAAARALRNVEIPPPAAIDYYGMIDAIGRPARVGDTVVFGFRPQAFVTRAYTAACRASPAARRRSAPIHDALGRPADWPV